MGFTSDLFHFFSNRCYQSIAPWRALRGSTLGRTDTITSLRTTLYTAG